MPFWLFNLLAFVAPIAIAVLTVVAIGSWRNAPRGWRIVWLLVCVFVIGASALGGLVVNIARDQFGPLRSNPIQATIIVLILLAIEILVSVVLYNKRAA